MSKKYNTQQNYVVEVNTPEQFVIEGNNNPKSLIILRGDNGITDKEELVKLARLMGGSDVHPEFGEVRDIRINPAVSARSLAMSMNAHPLHIDGAFVENPPTKFLLNCVKADVDGGGVSTFLSKTQLLLDCPGEFMHLLLDSTARIARVRVTGERDVYIGPLLSFLPDNTPILRWRYDKFVKPEVIDSFNMELTREAINWVKQYIDKAEKIEYQAQKGDVILIPNFMFLHGRTALTDKYSPRLMRRIWLK